MSEFINWDTMATYGGALAMVMMLTQFTKGLKFVNRIPTQIWSYILALVVMYPAMAFTGHLTVDTAIQTIFNAIIVSIAANGGFGVIQKITGQTTKTDTDDSRV